MNENVVKSVGEMLKSAREAKNVTLDVVNQNTKIAVDVLAALEQDDLEAFESDIYLKGFLRTYAKYLGINPSDVLRALDRQRGKFAATGTMWDIEETVTEEKLTSPRIFRRFVLPAMLLLIIALAVLFFNERRKVKRLTPSDQQGYVETVEVDMRAS